nr:T-cell receptor V beta CDR3 region {clone V8Inm5} [mice, NOD, islets, Peptide Partial, 16 aa] [Mus sp.]
CASSDRGRDGQDTQYF